VNDILDQLRSEAAERIHEGFDTRADIIENLGHVACESHGVELPERDLARIVDAELLEHYATQESWTEPTDCDRLDTAFARMEKRGLVARQHFTCCNTCARAEIGREIGTAEVEREVIGYAFYHMQDTEGVVEGGTIQIKYGPTNGTIAEQVGHLVCDALEESGLVVCWSGSADDVIEADLTDWRKRRENELPLTDQ
jgi:hypothetical protein